MPRSALRVRPAGVGDVPVLLELAGDLREALLPAAEGSLAGRPGTAGGRALLEQRLRDAIASEDRRLVVVVDDADEPLGMALLTVSAANALVDVPALHMTHAVVGDRHRRRGAGRALVAAAAARADELGLDHVVVSVRAGSREANRFFARLGFAPLAVRRTASVTTVRRHLAATDAAGVRRRVRRAPVPAQATAGRGGDPEGASPVRS